MSENKKLEIKKILLIGDVNVGKTSIIKRYIYHNTDLSKITNTSGVDMESKTVTYKEREYKLIIYDPAGQDRFKSLVSQYYRNTNFIIFVYDITNKDSIENIGNWINEVKKKDKFDNKYCLLVANKLDIYDQSSVINDKQTFYKSLEKKHDMKHFECSAKTNYGIEDIFNYSLSMIYSQSKSSELIAEKNIILNSVKNNNNERLCCY